MRNDTFSPEGSNNPIDFLGILTGIWREFGKTWWIGLILIALFSGFGLFQAKRSYVPYYRASASFVVTADKSATSISTSQYYNQISAQQLSSTFPYIVTSGALSRVVANDLGLPYVPGSISAKMLGNTNLFQISVTASDPQNAYNVLQSVVKNYPVVAEYVIGSTQLRLLEESGVPTAPYNSSDLRNTAVRWMTIGIGLYALMLVLLAINRRTIKNKRDLQTYLNLNYFGGLPLVRTKQRSKGRTVRVLVSEDVPDAFSEAMEKVQVRLDTLMRRNGWNTMFVSSSTTGEGKTTTSCNLALTMALKGARVLLIDGDLRHPSVANGMGHPEWSEDGGLRDYLEGRKDASALLKQYRQTSLLVMPGGRPTNDVAALMGTGRLNKLIAQCKKQVDYIIIDTPPCTAMHDATIIASMVETGILVVRQDYAPIGRVMTASEIMNQVNANLCGCLINGEMGSIGGYGYGRYGYGKYGYGRGGYARYSANARHGYGYGHSKTATAEGTINSPKKK